MPYKKCQRPLIQAIMKTAIVSSSSRMLLSHDLRPNQHPQVGWCGGKFGGDCVRRAVNPNKVVGITLIDIPSDTSDY